MTGAAATPRVIECHHASERQSAPRLSVVISCFNYEDYVAEAIRSVLDQKRTDCELVVVDDGSSDGSWQAIKGFDVHAFRIENVGQSSACRFGCSQTSAPFVLFLDADDELKPGSIERILELLDPKVAKLQFSLTHIDADGKAISSGSDQFEDFRAREELAQRVLRTGVYRTPPTSGNVFRRDLCQLLDEVDYDRAVDGVILFAAPFFGDVVGTREELGRYRIHDRNDSGLGRMPDATSLDRDIRRQAGRMDHLRRVLQRFGLDHALAATEDTFYVRERRFCLDLALGRRPAASRLPGLLASLMREPFTPKNKLAMAGFFLLAQLVPKDRAKSLLAYRLQPGRRSLGGLIQAIAAPV